MQVHSSAVTANCRDPVQGVILRNGSIIKFPPDLDDNLSGTMIMAKIMELHPQVVKKLAKSFINEAS